MSSFWFIQRDGELHGPGQGRCVGVLKVNLNTVWMITSQLSLSFLYTYYSLSSMAQYVFDRRRNNGPEDSFPPVFDSDPWSMASESERKTRKDRTPLDIRPICQ